MRKLLLAALVWWSTAGAEREVVVRVVGGPRTARTVSEEMGYLYKGPVSAGGFSGWKTKTVVAVSFWWTERFP